MNSRREFIKLSALGATALASTACVASEDKDSNEGKAIESNVAALSSGAKGGGVLISTWNHGIEANEAGMKQLHNGNSVLDAVEKGVNVVELDPENRSVGVGGRPDREGKVTLDACIMDSNYKCGAVAFIQDIGTPISVARKVMEETPHVMIVGEGARQFAIEQGFEPMNLLTEKSEEEWKEWLKESKYQPVVNQENHDTIGMLGLDADGNLAGACTTSGWAYKMHGRVGDSPIIGAGLYVDNEVGAACATGLGEAVVRTCGSHLVVELMRQGYSAQKACEEAVERIHRIHKDNLEGVQVGFLALGKDGDIGAYSVFNGFNYALHDSEGNRLIDSGHKLTYD